MHQLETKQYGHPKPLQRETVLKAEANVKLQSAFEVTSGMQTVSIACHFQSLNPDTSIIHRIKIHLPG